MAVAGNYKLNTERYEDQRGGHWPPVGRHILAHYDEDCIVVYQAFCPEIASYAVQNGKFGGPRYSFTRMTWIKTNFLWMMYRSKWAQKKNQERILAIFMCRDGFDQILKFAKGTGIRTEGRTPGNIRIQWDPDHDPRGENQRRRAVQIGIKGIPLQRFHEQYIEHIEDITDFVREQRQHVLKNELDKLITPLERVYRPSDEAICKHILLDEFRDSKNDPGKRKSVKDYDSETVSVIKEHERDEFAEASERNDSSCTVQRTLKPKPDTKTHKEDLILCLGGSFNPVHTGHIQLLDTAIKWLEKNSFYNVVAARLAVAPNSYVEKKCKRNREACMKAEHRIRLCELACKGHSLIKTYHTTTFSARNCGENVKKWENWQNAKVAVAIGADKAEFANGHWKWQSKNKCLIVCVGRKGKTDTVRKAYLEDIKEDIISNENFCLVEDEIEDVNSTEIRRQLREIENDIKSVKSYEKKKHVSMSSTMNERKEINNITIEDTSEDYLTLPVSWDETIDEDAQPVQEDNDNNLTGETVKDISNQYNPPKYELETEETSNVTPKSDELKINCANGNGSVQRNLDVKKKSQEASGIKTGKETSMQTRQQVIEHFVSTGWLAKPVGEYILHNYYDLYL